MDRDAHKFGIVRVRPASAESEGPLIEQLDELVQALEPEEPSGHSTITVPFSLDSSPLDDELVNRLSTILKQQLAKTPLLLIDLCYDRTIECYGILEWILYRSLLGLELEARGDSCKVYIYLELLPGAGERLFMLSPAMNGPSQIVFLDSDGSTFGPRGELNRDSTPLLHQYFSEYNRDLPGIFKRRLIRRRGVFGSSDPDNRYYKYQYILHGPHGLRELAELLTEFLTEWSISSVVFSDNSAGSWLEDCIVDAAERAKLPWSTMRDLKREEQLIDPALQPKVAVVKEHLRSGSDKRVCLLVPAYKNGRGYTDLYETCIQYGRTDFTSLVVIMDEERIQETSDEPDWFGTTKIQIGREEHTFHYICNAPIQYLEDDDWSVVAARTLSELEPPGSDLLDVTKVAMWSFLDDYPVGLEQPKPEGRPPISWFPLLHDLDEWDSLWVAWVLFETVRQQFDCRPESILVVIPSEKNASTRIATALEQRLGVAVARISRDVLNGTAEISKKDALLIDNFSALKVVAFDESTVTGSTLDSLSSIVKDCRGRGADMSLSLFRMADESNELNQHPAVFHWMPYLVGAMNG